MGKRDIGLDIMFSLYNFYSIAHHQYTYRSTEMEINICTFYIVTLTKHYEFGKNCLTCGLTRRKYPLKN